MRIENGLCEKVFMYKILGKKYFTSENNVVFLQHPPVPTITQTLITIIAFVRMHPNLGVPVVQNHIFSRCHRQLPIRRPY